MAKNFPYFKFIASEWMTGDIVFESFSAQGLFVNICALYWQRNGLLSIDDINKRYKNPEELNDLTGRFISVENGLISINFLDEQLIDAKHISKTNSDNGSKGGRPVSIKTGSILFYLLKCYSEDEIFYKSGITSETISRRFSNMNGNTKKMPYSFEVLFSENINVDKALFLENSISEKFKKHIPKIKFSGHNECYIPDYSILTHIISEIATTEVKANKSERKANESKEEKETEENKNKNKEKNNDNFLSDLLASESWLELTAMQSSSKFTPDQVKIYLKKYTDKMNAKIDYKISKSEFASHFVSWLDFQKPNIGPTAKKRVIS